MTPDERFDRIDANFERMFEAFSRLEARQVALEGRQDRQEASLAQLTRFVLDFREETARRLEVIDNRLDVLAAHVYNIDSRYPAFTKAIFEFGKIANQLTLDQAANKHAIAELAQKVSKLNPAA